jgi:signal transduction histidine kinase
MTSIKNVNGTITNYIALKEDISLRKQMEADLIIAINKAEESDRLKSAFLANMSHEIRTPLNSIIGFSELLADTDFEPEQKKEFVQYIIDNGNNLLNIISDILDISKMESGQITIRESQINVNKFIRGIKDQFAIKLKDKNLEFRLDIPKFDQEVFIVADVDRLRQVFNNLISNSLKFTSKGFIQISYHLNGEMVEFCVKDTGIGIPGEFHEKIFDRFRQVEASHTRKFGGNGLGLAITKNLIKLMGGNIWVDSVLGKGSWFYFTVPLLKTH